MATYTLPSKPGKFRVHLTPAGNYIVINDKTGKNQVIIPCRDEAHAREVCDLLNSGDHPGQVTV